jgi:hypothetical protein
MVPSLMLAIALAGTALGAGITRAHMMRRHRPRLFFVDAHGKVYTLADKRRPPSRDDSDRAVSSARRVRGS